MGDYLFADQFVLESNQTRDFYYEYLKGLVHKTNNVIGVIHGFSGLALMDDNMPKSVRESVEQIETASRQMSEINKKVLTAGGCARIDMGELSLNDFGPFLESKVSDICEKNAVPFTFTLASDLPKIQSDKARFSEVFEALICNAAEGAAADKGDVSVEFKLGESGNVDLFIHNTFKDEISPKKLNEYYEPFFSARGNSHFGIGLTIAAVLSGQMDSRLGIKAEDERFTSWLSIPTNG